VEYGQIILQVMAIFILIKYLKGGECALNTKVHFIKLLSIKLRRRYVQD
jgi:hypothetical protein